MVNRPRIKPPRIASRNKFLEVGGEDCDPLSVIRGIFLSMNTLLDIDFLIAVY